MKYAVLFVGAMLAGLTLLGLVPTEGPQDDPVNGQAVLSPLRQAIADNRDAWRAELIEAQRATPRGYANSVVMRRFDTPPSAAWEDRAWWEVYREWAAEDSGNGYGQGPRIGGPFRPGNYQPTYRNPEKTETDGDKR